MRERGNRESQVNPSSKIFTTPWARPSPHKPDINLVDPPSLDFQHVNLRTFRKHPLNICEEFLTF
jgi:hypothetical protein